nr:PucR family transcriptional regulator ligand-binding domain-containing protein [Bacillus piscicola]
MKIGGLRKCKVIAGHQGLDREMNVVTIMEVPDIIQWLKGKELMLTSMYPLKDDEQAQKKLIKDLNEKGTAALAIKPHRFIEDIPDILTEEAEKYNFPIIEIPEEVSYLDIISPVMNVVFDKKVVLQEDLDQAYQLLNEISLNKRGVNQFLQTLHHLLKNDILIESFVSYVEVLVDDKFSLASLKEEEKEELELIQRPIRMNRTLASSGESLFCLVAPIIVDGRLYGAITSIDVENHYLEVDISILERAATLLSLEFMRKKVAYELEEQYKSDFLRDLFYGQVQSEEVMTERGKLYNFDIQLDYICISVHFSVDGQGMKLVADQMNQLQLVCSHVDRRTLIGTMQNVIYLLLPTREKKEERIKQDVFFIYQELQKKTDSFLYMGVGRFQQGLKGLRQSFHQSELAVTLGRMLFKDKKLVFYDDLGVYRLLAEVKNIGELRNFYEETVGILVDYDERHDLELIHSLKTYFHLNESLSKTAKELFIHVNTMKYRLQKIKALTGLSMQNSEDKLMIQIGLKIHDFIKYDYRFR